MSELKLEQIGHPDAVSNSLTFDSDGTLATTTGFSSGGLKVKSSGGGTFSINPPSSASDRTLVLPDEAGTVLTTTSGVAKSGSTMTGALTIDTGTNGVPAINLNHSNTNADNFVIQLGTPGVSNAGFTIRDTDESANRFIIDNAGHVTMPYQPAFLASLSSSVTGTTYVNSLTFDTTEYNVGNHYSTSTGRFTAPISGLYQFILKLHTITNTFSEVKIYKNGGEIIRCYNPTGGNSVVRTGWAIGVVNLSSGDYVQGIFYDASNGSGTVQGGGDINNGSSTFQGYLIG